MPKGEFQLILLRLPFVTFKIGRLKSTQMNLESQDTYRYLNSDRLQKR
jgi:hypothetical protein